MAYKIISPMPIIEGGTGAITLTDNGVLVGSGTAAITALSVGATGTVLIGNTGADPSFDADPSVNSLTISGTVTNGTDAATKAYVDSVATGLTFLPAAVAGTTANLTATYANGASGVGATLTNSGAQAAFTIDGVSPNSSDRILIKDQTAQEENGVYTLTTVGDGSTNWVLTRATDYDTAAEMLPGVIVFVQTGTVNADMSFVQTETIATVGTDPVVWQTFNVGITSLTGGTNINVSGTTTVTVNLDAAITLATSVSSPLYTVASGDIILNMTDDAGTSVVSFTNDSDAEVASLDSLGSLVVAEADIDNININGNTIISTDTNGDITLTPDGSGTVNLSYLTQYTLPIAGASGAISDLSDGLGTNGQVLTSQGAGAEPTWADAGSILSYTAIDNTDSPYTVLTSDQIISVDCSAGTVTVLLPNAATLGTNYVIKDRTGSASTNNITVQTVSGAVNIDGATTFVMNTDYEAAHFLGNSSTWEVI